MNATMTRLAAASALSLGLIAAPALSAGMDWDGDGDGALADSEFNEGFDASGVFDSWDSDADGALSADEFNAGMYGGYDVDDSGIVEGTEIDAISDDFAEGGLFGD
jgi:hypothetical protein